MPLRVGDPGVFVCGPEDIAPWERPVRERANAGVDSAQLRTPARPAPSAGQLAWLVLALCPHCSPAHGGYYCREHNDRNWWLTRSGLGRGRPVRDVHVPGEKENAPDLGS